MNDLEHLSKANKFKYALLGRPKHCEACGKKLSVMTYGHKYDPRTGKRLSITTSLGCSCFAHGHTHIFFHQKVTNG